MKILKFYLFLISSLLVLSVCFSPIILWQFLVSNNDSDIYFDSKVETDKIVLNQREITFLNSTFDYSWSGKDNNLTNFSSYFSLNNFSYVSTNLVGCNDISAINYDPYFVISDNSCIYSQKQTHFNITSFENNTQVLIDNYLLVEGNFTNNISSLKYFNGDYWNDITSLLINQNQISQNLDVVGDNNTNIIFKYTDVYGLEKTDEYNLNITYSDIFLEDIIFDSKNYFETKNYEIDFYANISKSIFNAYYTIDNVTFNLNPILSEDGKNLDGEILINSFGNKTLKLYLESDKNLFSKSFDFEVQRKINQSDKDEDTILDSSDLIIWEESILTDNFENLTLKINNDSQVENNYNSELLIEIGQSKKTLIEYYHNFSDLNELILDFSNTQIIEDNSNNLTKILIKNLPMQENKTKTIYFKTQNINNRNTAICIVDKNIGSYNEISENCDQEFEYLFFDEGTKSNITLKYNSTQDIYSVSGLTHSAISQICFEDMVYTQWEDFDDDIEQRVYYDKNKCGFSENKTQTREKQKSEEEILDEDEEQNPSSSSSSSSPDKKKSEIYKIKFNSEKFDIYINGFMIDDEFLIKKGRYKFEVYDSLNNKIRFDYNIENNLNFTDFRFETQKNENELFLFIEGFNNFDNKITIKPNSLNDSICLSYDKTYKEQKDFDRGCFEQIINCIENYSNNIKCEKENSNFVLSNFYGSALMLYKLKDIEIEDTSNTLFEDVEKEEDSNLISNDYIETVEKTFEDNRRNIFIVTSILFLGLFLIWTFGKIITRRLRRLVSKKNDIHIETKQISHKNERELARHIEKNIKISSKPNMKKAKLISKMKKKIFKHDKKSVFDYIHKDTGNYIIKNNKVKNKK